ncbi:MAG: iron-sulfur cluster assembly scaffold protein, partial [Gammaproteobacteria bacterium]|nr:iron-sulfur cluster assembly scaffold protein [Gammaproteobacteria bacterium]
TGVVGSPACGDVLKIQILVDNNVITDAKFKAYGCCSVIASGSVATDELIGKTLDQALGILNTEIAALLDLPKIKVHCSMIAEKAIKAAVEDYQEKSKR